MDLKIIVAIISVSGVLLSAIIQFLLGRKADKTKNIIEIKTQAYLDFVNSVSEIASISKRTGIVENEHLKRITQSKSRVILIG